MRWLSGRTALMWNAANTVDADRYREAIIYWSYRRVDLPGPIFFTIAPDDELEGERQHVLDASEACCPCGMQRRYIPLKPRSFYAQTKPRPITLQETTPPLAITLWGGGVAETIVELLVADNTLVTRVCPRKPQKGVVEVQQTLPILAEKHEGLPLAFELRLRVKAAGNTPDFYAFETHAIYGVNPYRGTVDVMISRNCKQVNLGSIERPHQCG